MIRRINHTARKRIERRSLVITLDPAARAPIAATFCVDLDDYAFPRGSLVIAEAYGQARIARVELGKTGEGRLSQRFELPPFASPEGIHFRIKVIPPPPAEPKLLGLAESIAPEIGGDGASKSLLPVRRADLDQMVWRVDFEGPSGPVLEINQDLVAGTNYVRLAHFTALAHIEILRQILSEALSQGGVDEDPTAGSWQSRWIVLGAMLAGRECDSDGALEQVQQDWIRSACEGFARRRRALAVLNEAGKDDQ